MSINVFVIIYMVLNLMLLGYLIYCVLFRTKKSYPELCKEYLYTGWKSVVFDSIRMISNLADDACVQTKQLQQAPEGNIYLKGYLEGIKTSLEILRVLISK